MKITIADKSDMEKVFAIRMEVFVKEQNVPAEIELDGEDADATHIIAEQDGEALGCARVIFSGGDAHIGRLAVKRQHRGRKIGSLLCKYAIELCREYNVSRIWLNAQLHAVEFYQKLGFVQRGEVFYEAGIEHIQMEICG